MALVIAIRDTIHIPGCHLPLLPLAPPRAGSQDAGQEMLHQLEGTLAAQRAAWPPRPPTP